MISGLMVIVLIAYVIMFMTYLRWLVVQMEVNMNGQLMSLDRELEVMVGRKNELDRQRMVLSEEAVEIFTLYEITKDITKSLREEDAFHMFQGKLRQHVRFEECQLLEPKAPQVKQLQRAEGYFVFLLRGKQRKAGYLVIKGLVEKDREKALILTHQFVLALRRVKLYQEIEKVAITDSLTEVHTRRHTMERFEEELKRSMSKDLPLSYLMIDADHFKEVNDQYGHLTGDQVLREIAQIIKRNIREIDIPGRYGGEEFCVVLPDTDREGALFVAERIRQETEKADIKAYDHTIRVTLSIGLASYPADAKKFTDLTEQADFALYRAKKDGRNRVCCFKPGDGAA